MTTHKWLHSNDQYTHKSPGMEIRAMQDLHLGRAVMKPRQTKNPYLGLGCDDLHLDIRE